MKPVTADPASPISCLFGNPWSLLQSGGLPCLPRVYTGSRNLSPGPFYCTASAVISLFFDLKSFTKPELTDLSRLVSQQAPGVIPLFCFPRAESIGVYHCSSLLHGFWESNSGPQTCVAATVPLEHLPNPEDCVTHTVPTTV